VKALSLFFTQYCVCYCYFLISELNIGRFVTIQTTNLDIHIDLIHQKRVVCERKGVHLHFVIILLIFMILIILIFLLTLLITIKNFHVKVVDKKLILILIVNFASR